MLSKPSELGGHRPRVVLETDGAPDCCLGSTSKTRIRWLSCSEKTLRSVLLADVNLYVYTRRRESARHPEYLDYRQSEVMPSRSQAAA